MQSKRIIFILFFSFLFIQFDVLLAQVKASELTEVIKVSVKNPLNSNRNDALVILDYDEIKNLYPTFNANAFIVKDGTKEIQSQLKENGEKKELIFLIETIAPKASKEFSIHYKKEGEYKKNYPKRTQAELSHKTGGRFENRVYKGGDFKNIDSLRVPDEHTDHSFFIRYEGPGWESDKVGYRYYLDWRNAVDIFGKKTNAVVLQNVGLDGFDSYHEMQDWGMDVLKVGNALGVGSLAYFHEGKANRVDNTDSVVVIIRENGNLYSEIETQYYGWKIAGHELNLKSSLGIHAGSRMTKHQVLIEKGSPEHLSTGINKDKGVNIFSEKGGKDHWGYLASYGKQSLNGDQLGIAVLFPPSGFTGFTEDEFSHVVNLKASDKNVQYYFLAAWELELDGIKTEKEFLEYLQKSARELAQPLEVKISEAKTKARVQRK